MQAQTGQKQHSGYDESSHEIPSDGLNLTCEKPAGHRALRQSRLNGKHTPQLPLRPTVHPFDRRANGKLKEIYAASGGAGTQCIENCMQ
jgi:hypothetical protein